jgi:hypothetical protein
MLMLNALVLLLVFVLFVPLRLVARLSEKLLETTRTGGWETGFGDQTRLAFANGAALRQAQLYTAYPEPAHRAMQMLRLFGVR